MSSVAPKTEDLLAPPGEDEEDMTSIMSADQRKALQQAASDSKEAETLERDTARPPPPASATDMVAAVAIPKAPAVPALMAPERTATAPAVKSTPNPVEPAGPVNNWAAWELVAFVLLTLAVAVALKT